MFEESTEQPIADNSRFDGIKDAYLPSADVASSAAAFVDFHTDTADDLDPVDYEVIRHRLWMANEAQGNVITRVSGSPAVVFGNDLNTGMMLEDGEWVYSAPYVLFLNAGADLGVKYILENRAEDPGINEGDIWLTSDPWIAVNHTLDVVMLMPVFWEERLFCWVTNVVHYSDLGGTVPGSFSPEAPDVFWEPSAIPPLRIVERGKVLRDVEAMITRKSRQPDLAALDLRAGISGCTVAKDRIHELLEQFGAPTVKAAMRRVVDAAEIAFVDKLKMIPDGVYRDSLEVDDIRGESAQLYPMTLTMTKSGDRLIFENDGTAEQWGAQNTVYVGLVGGIVAGILPSLAHDQLFAIGGLLRHIDIRPTPNTMTAASPPAACSCYVCSIFSVAVLTVNCLGKAMSTQPSLMSDLLTSSAGPGWPLVSHYGSRNGEPFIAIGLDPLASGTSASGGGDGIDSGGFFAIPRALIPNVEEIEMTAGLLYLYRREATDTGGAGKFRGGIGVESAYIAHDTERIGHTLAGGGIYMPGSGGAFGGFPTPTVSRSILRDAGIQDQLASGAIPSAGDISGKRVEIMPNQSVWQGPDDVFVIRSNGGGGFGDPIDRDPASVAADVAGDCVSQAEAERVYGVALDAEGGVDEGATTERRNGIRRERLGGEPAGGPGRREDRLLSMAELLDIVPEGEGHSLCCAACGTTVGRLGEDAMEGAVERQRELTELAPFVDDPLEAVGLDIKLVERSCPGCGRLLDVDPRVPGATYNKATSMELAESHLQHSTVGAVAEEDN